MNKKYESPELLLYRLSEIATEDGVITPSTEVLPYGDYDAAQDADLDAEQYGDDA